MSLIIDIPKPATSLHRMFNMNLGIFNQKNDFDEYQAGKTITQPQDTQSENMSILAKGNIKVKIQSCLGEATIHIFKPGDLLKLSSISNISASEEITSNQTQITILAVGNIKLVKLEQVEIENKFHSESKLTYKLIQDMMQRWLESLQSMKAQCKEVKNYIYKVNGRY